MARGEGRGKVILLGEHAVVHGVPALTVALDRGAEAEANFLENDGASELAIGDWTARAGDGSELGQAFAALLSATETTRPVRVLARTDLLPSAGLGCSAALGVAITRALLTLKGIDDSPENVAARALAWEAIFHGNPSGIDTAIAARGGCLFYQRREGAPLVEPVRVGAKLVLAIGYTGTAAPTRAMVEAVARLREQKPAMVSKTFAAIEALVRDARLALEAGDVAGLGQLLNANQMLLSGLFVSTEEIETLCRLARENGAVGAKLTGAGGGGCVLALTETSPEPILEAWARAGFEGFAATIEANPIGTRVAR